MADGGSVISGELARIHADFTLIRICVKASTKVGSD